MEKIKQKEGLGIRGRVTIRSHPAGTIETLQALHSKGKHRAADRILEAGEIEARQKNLIVDSNGRGIDILIQFLMSGYNGSFAFTVGPGWGEIGTGTTAPGLLDTALAAPTNRAAVSYASDVAFNLAKLQFYFPDNQLANINYHEFGIFIGGDSSIGSGALFNHALFASPYSKSSGNDTTVEVDIAITNA